MRKGRATIKKLTSLRHESKVGSTECPETCCLYGTHTQPFPSFSLIRFEFFIWTPFKQFGRTPLPPPSTAPPPPHFHRITRKLHLYPQHLRPYYNECLLTRPNALLPCSLWGKPKVRIFSKKGKKKESCYLITVINVTIRFSKRSSNQLISFPPPPLGLPPFSDFSFSSLVSDAVFCCI